MLPIPTEVRSAVIPQPQVHLCESATQIMSNKSYLYQSTGQQYGDTSRETDKSTFAD